MVRSKTDSGQCFNEPECNEVCTTENEKQCETTDRQQCTTVSEEVCATEYREKCDTINEEKCDLVNEMKCETINKQKWIKLLRAYLKVQHYIICYFISIEILCLNVILNVYCVIHIIFQFIRIDYVEIVASYYYSTNIDAEALSSFVTLIVLLYPFKRLEQENLQTQIYINIDRTCCWNVSIFFASVFIRIKMLTTSYNQ